MPATLPAPVEIDVVFAKSTQAVRQANISDPAVVIFADHNTWNDYSRRLYADYRIFKDGELGPRKRLRFMFADQNNTAVEIDAILERYGRVVSIEHADRLYVSLLGTADGYRDFVQELGFDRAVSALRRMGDAVLLQLERHDEARLELMDSDAFYVSVLRADGAYNAFRRGGRFLRADTPEPVADSARSFLAVAQMPNVANHYDVVFNFDDDPFDRNRVSVLIGRNGVGKTQLLRHLILRLADEFEQDGFVGQVRLNPSPRVQRVLLFSSVTSDPYPRRIPPWHGIDYEYFSMTAVQDARSDALLQALVACKRDHDTQLRLQGRTVRRARLLETILSRLGLWENLYVPMRLPGDGEEDNFSHYAIEWAGGRYYPYVVSLSEGMGLQFVRLVDWSRQPIVLADNTPRHLSSGELAMFRFAAQAVSAIEQGSLLLFDEPETHLHPNYVSEFMGILQDLLAATNSAAIIATHSAYVVREVPRERVSVLTPRENEIEVSAPRLQTFGASIDTISQFVFNDTNIPHRFQRVLQRWVREHPDLTLDQIIETFGQELNPESLSFIAEVKRGGGLQEPAPEDDEDL